MLVWSLLRERAARPHHTFAPLSNTTSLITHHPPSLSPPTHTARKHTHAHKPPPQLDDLGTDASRRLRDAESAADALARAHLERLMELRNHRALLNVDAAASHAAAAAAMGGLYRGDHASDTASSGVDQPPTPPASTGFAGAGALSTTAFARRSLPGSGDVDGGQQGREAGQPSVGVHPAELDGGVEWHSGLPLLARHLQLNSGDLGPHELPGHPEAVVATSSHRTTTATSFQQGLHTAGSLGGALEAVPETDGYVEDYMSDSQSEHQHQLPQMHDSRTTASDSFAFSGAVSDQGAAADWQPPSTFSEPQSQPYHTFDNGHGGYSVGGAEQYADEQYHHQQYSEEQYQQHQQYEEDMYSQHVSTSHGAVNMGGFDGGYDDYGYDMGAARFSGISFEAPM